MRITPRSSWTLVLLVGGLLVTAACGRPPAKDSSLGAGSPDGPTAAPKPLANEARFHAALKEAAATYETFGEVDDTMRWVPGLCRSVRMTIHASQSDDAETHGGKLYWMFAKEREAYLRVAKQDQPVGQALVKEAWTSRPATAEDLAAAKSGRRRERESFHSDSNRTLERDGTRFTADQKKALFVMLKLGPAVKGTDEGWIYGTLTPDGQTVTSAGRVASCMACHVDAPRDRMFGLSKPR